MLNEDAKKFLLFQEHYETFNLLIKSNVFDVKNGKVELHFDSIGKLQSIHRADILYDKRFDTLRKSNV